MWSIDFISHYYDKIKATGDDTRTTTYKRLLDAIIKDYENKAAESTIYDIPEDETYTEAYDEPASSATLTGSSEAYSIETENNSPATEKNIEDMSLDELDREIERLKKLLDIAELKRREENE